MNIYELYGRLAESCAATALQLSKLEAGYKETLALLYDLKDGKVHLCCVQLTVDSWEIKPCGRCDDCIDVHEEVK